MKNSGNSNKKMIIIILCIIFLIVIGIICFLFLKRNSESQQNNENSQQSINGTVENASPETFKEVNSYNIYYTVKGILNNYITMIREANGDEYIEFGRLQQSRDEAIAGLVDESVNAIYNMFDSSYIII